jgi:hypothetical protein
VPHRPTLSTIGDERQIPPNRPPTDTTLHDVVGTEFPQLAILAALSAVDFPAGEHPTEVSVLRPPEDSGAICPRWRARCGEDSGADQRGMGGD